MIRSRLRTLFVYQPALQVYRNGALVGSTAAAFNLQVMPLTLGWSGSDEAFAGAIDEVRIWNTARTLAEIQANMRVTATGTEAGLAGAWRFDDRMGSTAANAVSDGSPAILGGGNPAQRPTWIGGAPTARRHTFIWDTFASGVFGQSDNVVIRLIAYPSSTTGPNGTPLFQRPYASAATFPFRVRGTQVQVVDPAGTPQRDAIVYRLPCDPTQPRGLMAPFPGHPAFTTDQNGYLAGRGALAISDTLIALAPVSPSDPRFPAAMRPFSDTVDLYATNLSFTQSPNGLQPQGHVVQTSGVQTVTVSLARLLALVSLIVSLEWDARSDERYTTQLRYNLQRASELLFDATNGQAALGRVDIFFAKENRDHAHIRIAASNRARPNAVIGGVATGPFTTTYTVDGQPNRVTYSPGQVIIGATWNRFGEPGVSLADDWSRVLVDELGHYLFFLDDHYVGRDSDTLITIPYAACPGIMHDPYASIEFHPQADWLDPGCTPNCAQTLAHRETGASDWTNIHTSFPGLYGAVRRVWRAGEPWSSAPGHSVH
ncbi:MAG: LamG domain-containing protein [Roseiflexus sp.]|nr:LamG domain-containing protein [Roseiflexus sp.]MCS7290729.1 LamG domain-containing protein [Roseiflexus sp.]MDW8147438.1 LamG-like jellyroll fold domain-containing protein [Roseiflexaceae bacterium]